MPRYAAFLRGINVGGNKMVGMSDLRACLEAEGFKNVRSLLQSGNLVLDSDGTAPSQLEERLEALCRTKLGLETRCFVRDLQQLEHVVATNPFPVEAQESPSRLLVVFLRECPDSDELEKVAKAISGPERLGSSGPHAYVVYPQGIGDSKVAKTPGWNALLGEGTARNWNTVGKVIEALGHE